MADQLKLVLILQIRWFDAANIIYFLSFPKNINFFISVNIFVNVVCGLIVTFFFIPI